MDPGWRGREISALLKYRGTDGWGPRPPVWKPGDSYVVVGAVVGMCAGGALGFRVGIVAGALGISAGGVCGALIGSLARSLIRKRK
jgi:outer membrane lipoprotein SlyB